MSINFYESSVNAARQSIGASFTLDGVGGVVVEIESWIDRLLSARKLCLVRDDKLQRRNLRKEFITTHEVQEKLREAGLERLDQVKLMYMESDGESSVIKRES